MGTKSEITIAVNGAAGRMGRRLVALAQETRGEKGLKVAAALEASGNSALGADAGELAGIGPLGVKLTDKLPASVAKVLIDFSLPEGVAARVAECRDAGVAMVIGTTGLEKKTEE